MADIYLFYVLAVADMGGQITEVDLNKHIPGLEEWRTAFAADPVSQRVDADKEANREDFFAYVSSLR